MAARIKGVEGTFRRVEETFRGVIISFVREQLITDFAVDQKIFLFSRKQLITC